VKYHISHTTTYQYSQPVKLSPHTLRLRPRCEGAQLLKQFAVEIQPSPLNVSEILDLEGNACLRVWFAEEAIASLKIRMVSEVSTYRTNPFDYLSEPWAVKAPIDYPSSIATRLAPYLTPGRSLALNPAVVDFAHTLLHEVESTVGLFLTRLTQAIYDRCQYFHRPAGDPQPAGVTLTQKSGSCRDFTVLFVECCRAVGLAARFVSGYQEGDPDVDIRELHAWPEVYIPGGGWRGFDPTHGLAVSDRHIALAAAAHPADAAPVAGTLRSGQPAQSTLDYHIRIGRMEE